MNTIGIDFGTSYCTASWINPVSNQPEVIKFLETGQEKMPSVVYYSPEGPIVGQTAFDMIEKLNNYPGEEREHILMSIKQAIKRDMKKGQKEYLPDGKVVSHEQIIADILKKIKTQAEEGCFGGDDVESVTVTHPVSFTNWQKEMLKDAIGIAGFKSFSLLEEPVAAAMGYAGCGAKVGNGILVYDFGGGTFDAAFVLKDEVGKFRVPLPSEGEQFCGGEDIDIALYDHFENLIQKQHKRNISEHPGRVDLQFKAVCRKHKEILSRMHTHDFSEILPPPGFVRFAVKTHRSELEATIAPVIDKTVAKTQALLNRTKKSGYEIDTIVLIGGSSRIPLVEEKLKGILPVEPLKTMQMDVAVALGAVVPMIKHQPKAQVKNEGDSGESCFCLSCRKQLAQGDKFCMYCGSQKIGALDKPKPQKLQDSTCYCISCGKKVSSSDRFCMYCGVEILG